MTLLEAIKGMRETLEAIAAPNGQHENLTKQYEIVAQRALRDLREAESLETDEGLRERVRWAMSSVDDIDNVDSVLALLDAKLRGTP